MCPECADETRYGDDYRTNYYWLCKACVDAADKYELASMVAMMCGET